MGAFGIEKPKQQVPETGEPAQRLIVNAPAANSIQHVIADDIRKLPYHQQFQALEMVDPDLIAVSSIEDLTSAFNIFMLGTPGYLTRRLANPSQELKFLNSDPTWR